MRITIDTRNIRGKKNKGHMAFVDFVYGKAVKNKNAEVVLRGKHGFDLVALNGVIGREC